MNEIGRCVTADGLSASETGRFSEQTPVYHTLGAHARASVEPR